jgi:DNA-binding response OmpR family regulator
LIPSNAAINQTVARPWWQLGYSCDVAGNGIEAAGGRGPAPLRPRPHGRQMPQTNGFEATAEIRGREAGGSPVPIIAMIAGALVEDRDRCLAASMGDYLSKPVKGVELERMLTQWLARARINSETTVRISCLGPPMEWG